MIAVGQIADPGDACHHCRGKGSEKEPTETGWLYSRCIWCNGTGCKSVMIFQNDGDTHAAHT